MPEAQISPVPEQKWIRKPWVRKAACILGLIAALYALVYADVVMRAREAYLEGEKYMRWQADPGAKTAEITAKFEKEKAALDKKLAKGKLKKEDCDRELEAAAFDRDRQMEESSAKYAYVWYQTAYELFSPPESKWVRLSRQKAPLAKEKWKEELRSKKIPFEEYMLE